MVTIGYMSLEFKNVHADSLSWISEEDMIDVDRVMIDDLRIELIQMMENTGRALSSVVQERSSASRIVVAACLLYTSPSPRDRQKSRMPSSA